jgi:hypothetical protein
MFKASSEDSVNRIELISGGLGAAPVGRNASGALEPICVDASSAALHIVLYPDLEFSDFERSLQASTGRRRLSLSRMKLETLAFAAAVLLFTALVVVFIGLLAVYQDLFSAALIDLDSGSRYQQLLLAGSALLAIVVINYLPSFFTAENSWLKNRLLQWKNQEYRVRRKLKREFLALQSKRPLALSVWNLSVADEQPWIWDYLVPVLTELAGPRSFYLSSSREQLTLSKLKALLTASVDAHLTPRRFSGYARPVEIATAVATMGAQDRALLKILQQVAGAICPDPSLSGLKINGIALERIIPYELYVYLIKVCWQALSGSEPANAEQVVASFFRRLKLDYGLLDSFFAHNKIYHHFMTTDPCGSGPILSVDSDFSLADYSANLQLFVRQSQEPVSVIAAINLLADSTESQVAALCGGSLIIQIRDRELYFLADILSYYLAGSQRPLCAEDCRGLSLAAIDALLDISERSGNYASALILADQLSKINRVRYRMIEARLLERQGHYLQAYEILLDLGRDYFDKQQPLTAEARELDLSFRLHLSWTLVSGRLIDHQHLGIAALDRAYELIVSLAGASVDPYLLWRYYNNRANYAEWGADLQAAARYHEEALTVPGVEQKWVSGTYTNLGIIYRMLLERDGAQEHFECSVDYLYKGLKIKKLIGDEDELPITLHNYALTLLTDYQLKTPAERELSQVRRAHLLAVEGLDILERSDSRKKKGVLLVEACIASMILENLGSDLPSAQVLPCAEWRNRCPADQYAEANALFLGFSEFNCSQG